MSDDYRDIIDLPHHVSRRHPPMPMANRAAQFMPFAALTGYDAAIDETARQTDEMAELTEDRLIILDRKIMQLRAVIAQKPEITVVYFQPDDRKEGGSYVTWTGVVKKIDDVAHALLLEPGLVVPAERLVSLEGEIFKFF